MQVTVAQQQESKGVIQAEKQTDQVNPQAGKVDYKQKTGRLGEPIDRKGGPLDTARKADRLAKLTQRKGGMRAKKQRDGQVESTVRKGGLHAEKQAGQLSKQNNQDIYCYTQTDKNKKKKQET